MKKYSFVWALLCLCACTGNKTQNNATTTGELQEQIAKVKGEIATLRTLLLID